MAKRTVLTSARLREILSYNPDTGKFFTRPKRVGSNTHGAVRIYVDGEQHLAHRLAYFWMTGQWPPDEFIVDHINGDWKDNRWINLRLATPTQNQRNRVNMNKNNSTGLTGAYRIQTKGYSGSRGGKQWFSVIGDRYLGLFSTKEEAHEAYRKEALKRYRDFAPRRLRTTP